MKSKLILLTFLLFPLFYGFGQKTKTQVFIISTIHKAHAINPNYTYNSLFSFVERVDPDVIGVELRQEDLDSSMAYLKEMYPFEMIESTKRFASKKVVGVDWLGKELEGKAVPLDYWKKTSAIKKLQQKLAADTTMVKALAVLKPLQDKKNELALKATLKEMNDGLYDSINRIYYHQLALLLKDTPYSQLSTFYQQRDAEIARNIVRVIMENSGKKLVFLIGADHRGYVLDKVDGEFGDSILLNKFNNGDE